MGNITTFYNQLAYTSNVNVPQPVPEGSVFASASAVLTYPVTGGPLPLIQAGDFTAFAAANTSLQVPATDDARRPINSIFFLPAKMLFSLLIQVLQLL